MTGDRWRLKGALYDHNFQRERLRRRLATERQMIEDLTTHELQQLGANLRRVWSTDLCSIEAAMRVTTGRLRAILLNECSGPWQSG